MNARSTAVVSDADYDAHLARLNKLSVEKHTHAYELDWDSPEYTFEPADPRLELPIFDPITHTDWYKNQTPRSARPSPSTATAPA